MNIQKKISIGMILILFTAVLLRPPVFCFAEELQIQSKAGIVMESSTGTIIFEKNAHELLPPASITKVMTLLLIYETIEAGKLTMDTIVTTSEHAADMGGSQVYLEAGEEQTVETLIKCICISSANDACVAMAEHIAGTEEAFVERMNERAKELGMNDTNFVNCCGLDADGHVSSAYDIAIMSRELMRSFPEITRFTTTWMDSIVHTTRNGSSEFGLTNTNKLIRQYEGITGLKTGSTGKALYCLSATATRNDIEMIAVILAAPDTKTRFREAANLLNYGFSQCRIYQDTYDDLEPITVKVEKSMQKTTELVPQDEFRYISVGKEELNAITREISLYERIVAPIEQGEELGMILYRLDGREIGRVPLVSKEKIVKSGYADYIKELLKLLTEKPEEGIVIGDTNLEDGTEKIGKEHGIYRYSDSYCHTLAAI